MMMSDAAREAYMSTGGDMDAAMDASVQAHADGIAAWGSESEYAIAHAEFGTELSQIGARSMISFTEDVKIAQQFANGGKIFQATISRAAAIFQPLETSTEAEVLIRHMVEVTEWLG